jgi:hypothetical protein
MALPIAAFSQAVRPLLEDLGLRKRADDTYTLEMPDEFLGTVSLGRATEHRVLEVWPMVGVRHQPTERRLGALLDRPTHAYLPATILCGIGYLMPAHKWTTWVVREGNINQSAAEIAKAIGDYGLPAIQERGSLERVYQALSGSDAMSSRRDAYVRPVLLAAMGRDDEAIQTMRLELDRRKDRRDEETVQYERLASRLTEEIVGRVPPRQEEKP